MDKRILFDIEGNTEGNQGYIVLKSDNPQPAQAVEQPDDSFSTVKAKTAHLNHIARGSLTLRHTPVILLG